MKETNDEINKKITCVHELEKVMQSPDCQFLWKKKATLTFFGTKPSPISKAFQPKRSKLEEPLFLISDYTDNNKLQQLNGIVAQE